MRPPQYDGAVRLHLHARGAITNLTIEPQPALARPQHGAVLLRVRAVGLNFRDVLNVLGEYPGDPGPPGGDASGVVDEESSGMRSAFGLGHAPLACVAIAAAPLLTGKPTVLSFEQASTLPVTWSTTHVALERASLCAGQRILVHAAAGGVGLKAIEYAHWLGSAAPAAIALEHCCCRGTSALALFPSPQALWALQKQQRSEPRQVITGTWHSFKPSSSQRRWLLQHGTGSRFVGL